MSFLKLSAALTAVALSVSTASAFEISLGSEISDQEFRDACLQMAQTEAVPTGDSICNKLELSRMISNVETAMYDKLSEANDNLPDHDYVVAKEGGASAHQLKAMRQSLSDTWAEGVWLSPSQGRYLNLQGLGNISVSYDLVRADFGMQRTTDTYNFQTMGIINARQKYANYRVDKMSVDYHFRYTVKVDGRTLYDGFIEHPDDYSISFNCTDPAGSVERRGCDTAIGREYKVGVTSWNWSEDSLASFLLVRSDSVFNDLVPHRLGSTIDIADRETPNVANVTPFIAVRSDLDSYTRSFKLVEGGKARFAFNQLNLYVAAQRNTPVSSGNGSGAAKYLADQQDCIAKARSDMLARKSDRAAAGFLLGMAGLGEAAAVVNNASGIAGMWEGLSSEERTMASSCLEARGHTGGIEGALASDNTAPAYAPYTGDSERTPQPVSGAASVRGQPLQNSTVGEPSVASTSASVIASNKVSGSAAGVLSGTANSSETREAIPLKRSPPIVPPRFLQGDHSGYCRVTFDVQPNGRTKNVATTICTSRILEESAIAAVKTWEYSPRLIDGQAVVHEGATSKLTFQVLGYDGKILPNPDGF